MKLSKREENKILEKELLENKYFKKFFLESEKIVKSTTIPLYKKRKEV